MLGDAVLASRMSAALLDRGVYVVGFSYPVVPKGKARIRVQLSAGTVHRGCMQCTCFASYLAWWRLAARARHACSWTRGLCARAPDMIGCQFKLTPSTYTCLCAAVLLLLLCCCCSA